MSEVRYQSGFGNEFVTEVIAGAVPQGQNSPQRHKLGLYTEQLSGTPFTVPRHEARRSWLYRIRPSANHPPYRRIDSKLLATPLAEPGPNRMRWDPLPIPTEPTDFVDGLVTVAASRGAPETGVSLHVYRANRGMRRVFWNADGELLIVPQLGQLAVATEMGRLEVAPGEIVVIPRGVRFRVDPRGSETRGYMCENHGAMLRLPDLGPIGANGLANPRDFLAPTAWYEDRDEPVEVVQKFHNSLWAIELDHSPLDVVGWHGNLTPYKYDLARFMVINTVSFDHPDPSIFTVLTSPTEAEGFANLDFAIFPPRWMVAEHSFRPPWFHRNVMNEYLGLIYGAYDAKASGFVPGGASLHNRMAAHGPDAASTAGAEAAELKPHKIENTLAFIFETRDILVPTRHALEIPELQRDYDACWQGLDRRFRPPAQ